MMWYLKVGCSSPWKSRLRSIPVDIIQDRAVFQVLQGPDHWELPELREKALLPLLIYHLLKEAGMDTILVGNIGIPVFDHMEEVGPDTRIVLRTFPVISWKIRLFPILLYSHQSPWGAFRSLWHPGKICRQASYLFKPERGRRSARNKAKIASQRKPFRLIQQVFRVTYRSCRFHGINPPAKFEPYPANAGVTGCQTPHGPWSNRPSAFSNGHFTTVRLTQRSR